MTKRLFFPTVLNIMKKIVYIISTSIFLPPPLKDKIIISC